MINLRKLESELWESADLLRAESKLTSQEYCMPVLGLIFLRYAYSRFRYVEAEIMKDRPVRNGRVLPVESIDFQQKSAIFLPEEARYEYLLNLEAGKVNIGEKVNHAMTLIEAESPQLSGVLPKTYTSFKNELLWELLRIFNNSALNDIQDDIIEGVYTVAEDFPRLIDASEGMKATQLSEDERRLLGEVSLVARYGEDESPLRPEQIIEPRRREDMGNSLWTTFNVIQENVVRGGLQGRKRNAEGRIRRAQTRAINGIDQNVTLNRALWTLAEGMQRLKKA